MARIHLFEFEDFNWFPNVIRNYMTDFLQFISNSADIYRDIVPLLLQALNQSKDKRIIDLASGGGGGLIALSKHLKEHRPELRIVLTDYYPNIPAFKRTAEQSEVFEFYAHSVDARNVPAELSGVRTQFLSLHHFRPADARKILQNAVDSGSPVALFEAQQRNVKSIISMVFSPLSVLLVTPFIRPFSVGRLLLTYVIPLVPLFVLWDGVVSALRTYSVDEMWKLIEDVDNYKSYEWQVGVKKRGPGGIPYLVGWKKG